MHYDGNVQPAKNGNPHRIFRVSHSAPLLRNRTMQFQCSARYQRNFAQENKMNYLDSQQIAPTFQSNCRAEDGQLDRSHWSGLCEGVLIPLGSLFAVFLLMLGVMLITT
jgi:hypothetical protein